MNDTPTATDTQTAAQTANDAQVETDAANADNAQAAANETAYEGIPGQDPDAYIADPNRDDAYDTGDGYVFDRDDSADDFRGEPVVEEPVLSPHESAIDFLLKERMRNADGPSSAQAQRHLEAIDAAKPKRDPKPLAKPAPPNPALKPWPAPEPVAATDR